MNLDELTPDQIADLEAKIKAKKKASEEKQKGEKTAYKQLQHDFVEMFFPKLVEIGSNLTSSKAVIFDASKTILELKKEIFKLSDIESEAQQSHSISNLDFSKTIIIGHNVIDGWDQEMASIGVTRVNRWINEKITDVTAKSWITELLKPNRDGFLKASRVLELRNKANERGDEELIEAVDFIAKAYRPVKTSTYVKAKYKDENGQDAWLQLSMSNA